MVSTSYLLSTVVTKVVVIVIETLLLQNGRVPLFTVSVVEEWCLTGLSDCTVGPSVLFT